MSESNGDTFVFPYYNGSAKVYGDPEDLHLRLLEAAQGQLGKLLEKSRERGPENEKEDTPEVRAAKEEERQLVFLGAIPALRKLESLTRMAFGMIPFDPETGRGATSRDCNATLTAFFRFLDGEKKSTDGSQTEPIPSESVPVS